MEHKIVADVTFNGNPSSLTLDPSREMENRRWFWSLANRKILSCELATSYLGKKYFGKIH